ncbi:MAG: peptidoglycan-binding protein [Egibacteraceae bacterium]
MSRRQNAVVTVVTVAAVAAIAIGWLTRPSASSRVIEATHAGPPHTAPIVRADLVARELTLGTLGFAGSLSIVNLESDGVVTWVPAPGDVVERGQTLYRVNDRPIPLFYGDTPAWRDLCLGIEDGADIAQLEANLVSLTYADDLIAQPDARFDEATDLAVRRWQYDIGVELTGVVELGQAVFLPEALRITEAQAPAGSLVVVGGPVIAGTFTTPVVRVPLDAARQTDVEVGDSVVVTLPGERDVPGRVSEVSRVAAGPPNAAADDAAAGVEAATVLVTITLDDPGVAGMLDQAPVEVAISTQERAGVFAVPVTALLAQAGGGYAITIVSDDSTRRRIPVTVGIFDELAGLIEISGTDLREGDQVEVPAE